MEPNPCVMGSKGGDSCGPEINWQESSTQCQQGAAQPEVDQG